jgi:hypothetical protein
LPKPPFQALTVKSSRIANRIITDIQVCEPFDLENPPNPQPAVVKAKALWDTGATASVITSQLATQLGLKPVGQVVVSHAGGSGSSPTYLVNLILPNRVLITGVLAATLLGTAPSLSGFDVIVGMDIISLGDLSITNVGGQTWMSFRTPSCVAIDYVSEHERLMFSGVSRNDPCPCGKRNAQGNPVKFKKCHGR